LILQDYGLLPWATVQENAGLGLRMRRFYGPDEVHAPADDPVADIDLRVDHWIDRLGLSDARHQFPSQLSGGQRQRTAIARTLVMQPDLLLMDEPFASLDAPTRASLQDLVWVLRREHDLTTIIVTHTIEEAALLGNHILLLKNPPTTKAVIVANTEAGTPGFGESDAYKAVCGQLYKRMGEQA
jgi:NitT/TauT family transport system ATP-binding protein